MIEILKKESIQLKDWEFEFQQRGEQPISLCDFFSRSLERYFFSAIGATVQHCDYLFTDSSKGYNNHLHKEAVAKILKEKVSHRASLRKILANSINIPRSFNSVADTLTKELTDENIPNRKLAAYWKEMDENFLKVIPWFFYPWYLSKENLLTDKVKAGLEKHRRAIESICDFDEALLAVVFPTKKTAFQLEQEDMLELVHIAEQGGNFKEDPLFKEKAEVYLKKYDWLTTFILTPLLPMTYAQLLERVERAVKEGFKENVTLQKKTLQKNKETAQKVIAVIGEDGSLLEDIEDARELGYVLTAGVEEAYMSSARYLPFIQLVAKRVGVDFRDTKYLLSEEVHGALLNEQPILPEVVNRRRKGFVMMMKGGVQYASFGEEGHQISRWIDRELNKIDENIQELKGQPACKGFTTGKVRVALQPSQSHSLTEGEVLVCPMTNPDYVPAMRRSAAIVTDEGGLLSHAAIMSREFGKPCVIATKIATQVLKDGDLIEVDANKGVVRILETAEKKEVDYFDKIKNTNWYIDWSGTFPMAESSMAPEVYLSSLADVFDRKFSRLLIIYKDGIATGRLPYNEYKVIGVYLGKKVRDIGYAKSWASEFKKTADILRKSLNVTPEQFLHNLRSLHSAYVKYGAYIVATKMVFNYLPYDISPEISKLLESARKYYETFYQDNARAFAISAELISKNTGYKIESVLMMTRSEIFDFLKTKKVPKESELKKRLKCSVMYWDNQGLHELSSSDLKVIEREWKSGMDASLSGVTAYGGKVTGVCKIIQDYKEADLLRGEILVTGMTDPHFMSLMKKAAAIVTDAGGILSHAAIVSRELKIPCVVGTTVATQVLKNGDLVEVDADKGRIRVIERAQR